MSSKLAIALVADGHNEVAQVFASLAKKGEEFARALLTLREKLDRFAGRAGGGGER